MTRYTAYRTLVLPIAALLALALFGTTATAGEYITARTDSADVRHPVHHRKLIAPATFAAVGDSITAGYAGMLGWPAFTTGVQYQSGWFQVGLRSDQIVSGALTHGVPDANVLVIMGCTNDLIQGYDWNACLVNWDVLDAAFNMATIVSAVAPSNAVPATTLEYNAALKVHAAEMGWTFVDPYISVRQADGTYVPGFQRDASVDPYHPSNEAQAVAAAVLATAIFAVASQQKLL